MASLPTVANNVAGLTEALTSQRLWQLPADHVMVLENPASADAVVHELRRACDRAVDTILFYYSGHGLVNDDGPLHLALSNSLPTRPDATAISYERIRQTLRRSWAERRIVILDCSYAGRAEAML